MLINPQLTTIIFLYVGVLIGIAIIPGGKLYDTVMKHPFNHLFLILIIYVLLEMLPKMFPNLSFITHNVFIIGIAILLGLTLID